jgi:hypothetical protein
MEKGVCYVPVSVGEFYDKYTILQIKQERIKDEDKLVMVKKELEYLKIYVDKLNLDTLLVEEIKSINEILWNIEDNIRDKERKKEFDQEFISFARQVYITNDKRSQIKNKINSKLNSGLIEIKSYTEY